MSTIKDRNGMDLTEAGGFPCDSAGKESACNCRVQSLGQEDPLEKEMTMYSSVLAWRIPGMEELGRLLSMGSHRVGYD